MENLRPGDASRITREYTDSILIEMRHLDAVMPDTSMEIFGRKFDTPITMAAFSHLSYFGYHEDGMVEIAHGAAMANALNFAGMGDEDELERIIATGAVTAKIVKPYADNERIIRKLEHAEKAGAFDRCEACRPCWRRSAAVISPDGRQRAVCVSPNLPPHTCATPNSRIPLLREPSKSRM